MYFFYSFLLHFFYFILLLPLEDVALCRANRSKPLILCVVFSPRQKMQGNCKKCSIVEVPSTLANTTFTFGMPSPTIMWYMHILDEFYLIPNVLRLMDRDEVLYTLLLHSHSFIEPYCRTNENEVSQKASQS